MEAEKEKTPKKPLSKRKLTFLAELEIRSYPEIIIQKFTKEKVMLEPKAVALYDFIQGAEFLINNGKTSLISKFDLARDIFRELYPESYYTLLD